MNARLPRIFRLAAAGAALVGLGLALTMTISKTSHAFTLIELQLFWDPILVGPDQGAEVAFSNTFGATPVQVQVIATQTATGAPVAQLPAVEVAPGHGFVQALPAVQTGNANDAASSQNGQIIVVCRVTPNNGTLPRGFQSQVGAAVHIFNKTTHDIVVSQVPALVPAVQ